MSTNALIQEIEAWAAKADPVTYGKWKEGYQTAINDVKVIIRQHQVDRSQSVNVAGYSFPVSDVERPYYAMGDASTRMDEGRIGATGAATTASALSTSSANADTLNRCREAFEKWARTTGYDPHQHEKHVYENAWKAWQAAWEEVSRSQILGDKHEKDMLQVIDERDAAQEALSQAYYLITGRSPEWSNHFGYAEALEEIDDAQRLLRVSIPKQQAQPSEIPVNDESTLAATISTALSKHFDYYEGNLDDLTILIIDAIHPYLREPKREASNRYPALVAASQDLLIAMNTEMGTGITAAMAKVRQIIETEDSEIDVSEMTHEEHEAFAKQKLDIASMLGDDNDSKDGSGNG